MKRKSGTSDLSKRVGESLVEAKLEAKSTAKYL
jgi:hypothetical protein